MRARAISTIAALGVAGALFVPFTAHASSATVTGDWRAAAAAAATQARSGEGGHRGGEEEDWDLIGFFDSRRECVESADWVEDHYDADTVCLPARGGHGHGHEHESEDKDWLLFAEFPRWVHRGHRGHH